MSENRLAHETSPYLLQHKNNPVDWWPWGPEALAEAKQANKPILLSVGYAACHWCHVMAHESFEDEATAAVMNELFVNIKVDREERPDIDAIYMGTLHALGEQGGWPMTMFLDSEARPFWGGTYFPKDPLYGRPAFRDVLRQVAHIYQQEPEKIARSGLALTEALTPKEAARAALEIDDTLLEDVTRKMVAAVDLQSGGIRGAPKFPQWSFFWLLWRGAIRYDVEPAKSAVVTTLNNICQGGIYDHLGGGFARYSVDEVWLVPHFEKMLYDNALLIDLLTEVYRETASPLFKVRVAETVGWLEREMIADGSGFAASLDADSEGVEGKFYVWSLDEIIAALGEEDGRFFAKAYDVSTGGNWEDHNILNRLSLLELGSEEHEARLADLRSKLLETRARRVRPGWDDKVLADWNGLMIAAIARASFIFDQPGWLRLGERAFEFVATHMIENGRLLHSYRQGRAHAPATASDYANMIWGALRLHEATVDQRYIDKAIAWTDILDRHYWMDDLGGYATSADDTDDVIVRLRPGSDDATPNANAIMISNLIALGSLTGKSRYAERAQAILAAFGSSLTRNIVAHTGMLASSIDMIAPQQVIVAGKNLQGSQELIEVIRTLSLPGALLYGLNDKQNPQLQALADKTSVNQHSVTYVCLGPQCSPPQSEGEELRKTLKQNRKR